MSLTGLCILLVEDEPLIAFDLAETLEIAGARVVGPVRSLSSAFSILEKTASSDLWDAVVLDYSLTDGTSEPFAEALKRANVPFLIHSGNVEFLFALASRLNAPLVGKPSDDATLVKAVSRAIRTRAIHD